VALLDRLDYWVEEALMQTTKEFDDAKQEIAEWDLPDEIPVDSRTEDKI
jgi:hypothetical protein